MIINYKWNESIISNEVIIESHPLNKTKLQKLEQFINKNSKINVVEIKNNRTVIIDAMQIESINSCGHLSEVFTIDNQRYYLNKRMKELGYLETFSLFKINQSTILNFNEVNSFRVSNNSRLEIITKNQTTYIVSRHYAKQIRERLTCSET